MCQTLISILISILISAVSTLISVVSILSVPRTLTKSHTFAGVVHVCRCGVRLPVWDTFAGVGIRLPVGFAFVGSF